MLQSETNDQTQDNHRQSQGTVNLNNIDPNATLNPRGSIDTQGRVYDEENIGISTPMAKITKHDIKFDGMDLEGILQAITSI